MDYETQKAQKQYLELTDNVVNQLKEHGFAAQASNFSEVSNILSNFFQTNAAHKINDKHELEQIKKDRLIYLGVREIPNHELKAKDVYEKSCKTISECTVNLFGKNELVRDDVIKRINNLVVKIAQETQELVKQNDAISPVLHIKTSIGAEQVANRGFEVTNAPLRRGFVAEKKNTYIFDNAMCNFALDNLILKVSVEEKFKDKIEAITSAANAFVVALQKNHTMVMNSELKDKKGILRTELEIINGGDELAKVATNLKNRTANGTGLQEILEKYCANLHSLTKRVNHHTSELEKQSKARSI